MKKILCAILAVALVLSLAACGGGSKKAELKGVGADILPRLEIKSEVTVPSDFKIGMICLHDENSTYDKNFIDGLKEVQKAMGLKDDQVIIVTGIGEDNSCYDTAVDLAKKGCKIVFADSFGHGDFMLKAAKEYPDVQFCHATGTASKQAGVANFHNAFASIYEGRYLAGIVAGMKLNEMIKDGKIKAEEAIIGYVGAFTYAEVVSGLTSFFLGARSICPTATMKVRYTGSWYDPDQEQEAANALIEKDNCALISQHADSLGAPTACEVAGVPNVSYNGSTYEAGKTTFLVSSAINWAPYFQYIIESVVNGKAFETDWCGNIETNSVVLTGLNLDVVAEGTEEKVNEAIKGFKDGTLHVFDISTFTSDKIVDGQYLADVDGDFTGETNVIHDGYFDESNAKDYRSAPYFDINIDGITYLNTKF